MNLCINMPCPGFCLVLSRESSTRSLLIRNSQNRPSPNIKTHPKMQFTALFSLATSLAVASAGVIKERQWDGAVAVLNVFDYNTTNCAGDEPTVSIGVGPLALDQCIPFSQGYWTVSYSYLESLDHSGKLHRRAGM